MSLVFIEPSPDGGYQINAADGSPPHRGFSTLDEAVGTARLYGDQPWVVGADGPDPAGLGRYGVRNGRGPTHEARGTL
jgi:hypothetical protein